MQDRLRVGWCRAILGFLSLVTLISFSPDAAAAFRAKLQGLNKGGSTWIEGNLMDWQELDYIPVRVLVTGGPATSQTIQVEFDHLRGTIPGISLGLNYSF